MSPSQAREDEPKQVLCERRATTHMLNITNFVSSVSLVTVQAIRAQLGLDDHGNELEIRCSLQRYRSLRRMSEPDRAIDDINARQFCRYTTTVNRIRFRRHKHLCYDFSSRIIGFSTTLLDPDKEQVESQHCFSHSTRNQGRTGWSLSGDGGSDGRGHDGS